MGTSSSAAQLASKIGRYAADVNDANREGVREAGIVAKAIFIESLPTRRLANLGKSGGRLGATFTQPTAGSNPSTTVRYTGAAHLQNTGAARHLIGPKGWRRGRNARNGGLKFTGGDGEIRRGVVMHPGTRGQAFAPNAKRKAIAAAPKQIQMAQRRALLKVFG